MADGLEGMNWPDLAQATIEQKWRVFKAEHLRIGHLFTRLAVREEIREANGWRDEGPMGNVTPMELLGLYERIEKAETSAERYAILAEPIPEKAQPTDEKPLFWFDIIHGLTAPHIIKSVGQAAFELIPEEEEVWSEALDLGTGTGNLAAVLLGQKDAPRSVQKLTTVDKEQPLLDIAKSRYPEVSHVRSDVRSLPFPDASFDLIASGGLVYALEYDDQTALFKEVARLLKPGGVYLDGDYHNTFLHPDNVYAGPKYDLESFIVGHISPLEIAPPKRWKKFLGGLGVQIEVYEPEDFTQFGLQYSERQYQGDRANEITDVRALHKPK